MIGVPILILIGYVHYKRSSVFRAEADIHMEVNPYFRRILFNTELMIPSYLKMTELLVKLSQNEKLSPSELEEIKKLQNELKEHMEFKNTKYKRQQIQESSLAKLRELDEK